MRKNAVKAARLQDQGLTIRQIAAEMEIARSTVGALLYDPDGLKDRSRKASYGGTCEVCGTATDGSNGAAKAPKRCLKCATEAVRGGHGTPGSYRRGCSCDQCRGANREYMRSLKGKEPPHHGTQSAYNNYGCRCEDCRQAHREHERLHNKEHKRRWELSVRGTRPPTHGTSTSYNVYGCRCDVCVAAAAEKRRVRAARKKAAQA